MLPFLYLFVESKCSQCCGPSPRKQNWCSSLETFGKSELKSEFTIEHGKAGRECIMVSHVRVFTGVKTLLPFLFFLFFLAASQTSKWHISCKSKRYEWQMLKDKENRYRQRFPQATVERVQSVWPQFVQGSLQEKKKNLNEPETHFWALGLRAASVICLHQVYFVKEKKE